MNKNFNFFSRLKNKIGSIHFLNAPFNFIKKSFSEQPYKSHLHLTAILSLIVVITVQSFECISFFEGVGFIFKNTYFFIVNYLLVLSTLSIVFFFRKRTVLLILLSLLWVVLGFSNFLLILNRPMPLSAIDFVIMGTTMDIIPHYFSGFHVFLCAVAIVAGISLFTFLFIKAKKYCRTFKTAATPFLASVCAFIIFLFGGALSGNLKVSYTDVRAAYDNHGFIYCFASSVFVKGIPKPTDYSLNDIEKTVAEYDNVKSESSITPNVIVVQLESFFDTAKYEKYPLSNDPIPNFHRICAEFGEGSIVVPSNGGGTVNTEFEVLTGMNLEYFGTIEYPYSTILKNKTCESAAFILGNHGYKSHAIHNHTGVFYARNQVYPNLGFDTFTPIEFMQYEEAGNGWARDTAVYDSIVESLESTPGNDFVFAVTVQGHGAYLSDDNPEIPYKIMGREEMQPSAFKKACMYEYYCNLLSETDAVIGQIYDYVMNSDEEYVVVLYGDHLPSLDFDSELYEYGSDYMTTYTVFSNIPDKFNFEFSDELPAYRLMSSVFEKLGIDNGIINRINRLYENDEYEKNHRDIQYDMLYGEGYSLNGKPYVKKETTFGSKDIEITSAIYSDGFLTLRGNNFTKKSEININGRERETAFIDSNTILCACPEIEKGDIISVCQTAVDGTKLKEIVYVPSLP